MKRVASVSSVSSASSIQEGTSLSAAIELEQAMDVDSPSPQDDQESKELERRKLYLESLTPSAKKSSTTKAAQQFRVLSGGRHLCAPCYYATGLMDSVLSKNSTTKNFRKHVTSAKCHLRAQDPQLVEEIMAEREPSVTPDQTPDVPDIRQSWAKTAFSPEAANAALLDLIVDSCLPFSIVRSKKFQAFTKALNVAYKPPSEKTLKDDLVKQNLSIKELIQQVIDDPGNRISAGLMADEWTARNKKSYFSLYYQAASESTGLPLVILLEVVPVSGRSARELSVHVLDILCSYNLFTADKIVPFLTSFTTDTTSVMPAMVRELGLQWIPCSCHVLNLAINDTFSVPKISNADKKKFKKYVAIRSENEGRPVDLYYEDLDLEEPDLMSYLSQGLGQFVEGGEVDEFDIVEDSTPLTLPLELVFPPPTDTERMDELYDRLMVPNILGKFQKLVNHIRASGPELEDLKRHQEDLGQGFPQLVPIFAIRWTSLQSFADAIVRNKCPLQAMYCPDERDQLPPTNKSLLAKWKLTPSHFEWDLITDVAALLHPMMELSKELQLGGVPTLSRMWSGFYSIVETLRKVQPKFLTERAKAACNVLVGSLQTRFLDKFGSEVDNVVSSSNYVLATLLDPFVKNRFGLFPPESRRDATARLIALLRSEEPPLDLSKVKDPAPAAIPSYLSSYYDIAVRSAPAVVDSDVEAEFERWMSAEPLFVPAESPPDVIGFFRQLRCHRIYRLYLRNCFLPASSAEVERLWSFATRIDNRLRNGLGTELVAAILFYGTNSELKSLARHYKDKQK